MQKVNIERVFAERVNLAGKMWEDSLNRYKSTSHFRPIKKFRVWLDHIRCGTEFANACDIYYEYCNKK